MLVTVIKYIIGYVLLVSLVLFGITWSRAQMFDPYDEPGGNRRAPVFGQSRMPAILDQDMNLRYVLPMAPDTYVITPPLEADNLTGLTPKQPPSKPESPFWYGNTRAEREWLYRPWEGTRGQR